MLSYSIIFYKSRTVSFLNYIFLNILIIMELRLKEFFDVILQTLTDKVTIKINGSLTSEDIFRTVI